MAELVRPYLPFMGPVFFILMWLIVTVLLGFLSGWYVLMRAYPNRIEKPLLELRGQSGSMGFGLGMRRILILRVCPSGLQIGLMRIFGPWCQDFFVPWKNIKVERKDKFFWTEVELQFGSPALGKLSLAPHVANQLARAAAGDWPEVGDFSEETNPQVFVRLARQWILTTFVAALFFLIVSRIAAAPKAEIPVAVAILFPAFVFGIGALFEYCSQTKK